MNIEISISEYVINIGCNYYLPDHVDVEVIRTMACFLNLDEIPCGEYNIIFSSLDSKKIYTLLISIADNIDRINLTDDPAQIVIMN